MTLDFIVGLPSAPLHESYLFCLLFAQSNEPVTLSPTGMDRTAVSRVRHGAHAWSDSLTVTMWNHLDLCR